MWQQCQLQVLVAVQVSAEAWAEAKGDCASYATIGIKAGNVLSQSRVAWWCLVNACGGVM